LSAVLDLGTVKSRLKPVADSESAEVVVLTSNGRPLLGTHATAGALTPIDADTLKRLLARPREAVSLKGHHQREVLAVADTPRSLAVVVVAERDRAEIFAAWLDLLQLFLLLTLASTLLVGLIAYWMGRSIVTPLNSLTAAADGIARGDLDVQLRDAPAGEIGDLTRVFNMMTEELRRSHRLLEKLAVTDGLTGLYNRNKFDDILADQFARFERNHRPFAVLMLDLDHFKAINDNHGHAAGDQVLSDVGSILKQSIRSIDYAARYGGEEFVLVVVDTASEAAVEIAERIRAAIARRRLDAQDQRLAVTVSIGVSQSRDDDRGPDEVLARVDQALYQAKRDGRNRVRCAA
jgi:diguanylate cyclase (GGDEF)-like protein